jgi:hypothetical protein
MFNIKRALMSFREREKEREKDRHRDTVFLHKYFYVRKVMLVDWQSSLSGRAPA